jgi:hypothetical protein
VLLHYEDQLATAIREIKAVSSEKHMKHRNALCEHNAEFSSVAAGDM